jgi:hypothetical protein
VALWVLTALFFARVVAQPAALVFSAPWLPPFDAWHSGAIAYPLLVVSQIAILAWMSWTSWRVCQDRCHANRRFGAWLLAAAGLYGLVMSGRLLLGLTVLRDVSWFARPVPAAFHLVLAGFLGVYGQLHHRHG